MLPQDLVAEYWLKVKALVQERHGLNAKLAEKWTDEFRQLATMRIGDMIYNKNAEDIAEIVVFGAKQGGFPEPEITTNSVAR